MKSLDVVALGSCYVDINAEQFPINTEGIPPETELIGDSYNMQAGGSNVNFCRMLGILGLETSFIGMAGKDYAGDVLGSLMQEASIRPEIIKKPELYTNLSFNMTSPEGTHVMCVVGNANAALNPDDVIPLITDFAEKAKMIYLGGCFKLKSFADSFAQIAEIANNSSADIIVDHNRIPQNISGSMVESVKELVLKSNYYFPSRQEFCQLWEVGGIEEGLKLLNDRAPNLLTVVKDGGNGAFYYSGGSVNNVPAKRADKVLDVTGAGDSFNAGVIAALLNDFSIFESVDYGCSVATAKISGQQIPKLEL